MAQFRAFLLILLLPAAPFRHLPLVLLPARLLVVERGAVLRRRCGGGATAAPHLRCRLHLQNVNDRSRGRGNGVDALQRAECGEPLNQTGANHLRGVDHMR
eukprot:scaffold64486_cov56-Phaeocystis_antarctica.AAC.1